MNEKKYLDLQNKLLEILSPLENLPKEIKQIGESFIIFRQELTKESDRGCALLAASHLEYLLEKMLDIKLIGTTKQRKALFDFNGPLGSFSSRILMSYSIGLLTKFEVNDLQLIRKIRNEFGHSPEIIDFENPKIASLCNGLKQIVIANKTSREKFTTCASFLIGTLIAMSKSEIRFNEKPELNIEEDKIRDEKNRKILKYLLKIETIK